MHTCADTHKAGAAAAKNKNNFAKPDCFQRTDPSVSPTATASSFAGICLLLKKPLLGFKGRTHTYTHTQQQENKHGLLTGTVGNNRANDNGS